MTTATLLGSLALADDRPADVTVDPAALFQQLDANGDGQVAGDEVPSEKRALFDRLLRTADKDGDGRLNPGELATGLRPDPPKRPGGPPANREGGPLERLQRMDANGDGKIALDEVPEPAKPFFERILDQFDDDADDAISLQELRAAMPRLREQFEKFRGPRGRLDGRRPEGESPLLAALDKNHDGSLDADEIDAAPAALRALDKNGDGKLSAEEVGPQDRPRPDAPPGGAPPVGGLAQRLRAADANGDGKISRDEAPPRLRERFERFDRNGDGFIDQDELRDRLNRGAGKLKAQPIGKKKKGGEV